MRAAEWYKRAGGGDTTAGGWDMRSGYKREQEDGEFNAGERGIRARKGGTKLGKETRN
jgi:hypothetical protein